MFKTLLKQLLVLQVSDPYSSTDFTLELKIFSLVCLEINLHYNPTPKVVCASCTSDGGMFDTTKYV